MLLVLFSILEMDVDAHEPVSDVADHIHRAHQLDNNTIVIQTMYSHLLRQNFENRQNLMIQ